MRVVVIPLLCALAVASAQYTEDDLRVTVSQGRIIGNHIAEGDYFAFYGVEYGGPTSGKHRFKETEPTEVTPMSYHDYTDVVAVNKGVRCAQPTSNGIVGVEDCLVLDIYTKNLKTTNQPVFVWLEGEDYERTSNVSYPIENLVQHGLVVISVKYRLSIFGFLCLGVPEAPGNAGLKDVILALKWIQKNAAIFGGDPKNVMLAGHGSGAAMVDMITMSPLSENLVHKALVLSGSALAPWAISHKPIENAKKVAKKLQNSNKTPRELAELFEKTDLNVLGGALIGNEYYNSPPLFAPCIENSKLKETLLDDAPLNILRSGKYNDIPYVAGYTDLEGTMREEINRNWEFDLKYKFVKYLPADIVAKDGVDEITIRNFYFGVNPEYNISSFFKFEGDILVLVPITRGVLERAKTSKSPVRIFEFAYSIGTENTYSNPTITGARHGELLNYLFNYNLKQNSNEAQVAVQSRVVAFAKTGSAQPPSTIEWPPTTSSNLHLLYLSGREVEPQFFIYKEETPGNINENRTNFWKKIYETNIQLPKSVNTRSSANSLLGFGIVTLLAQIIIRFV